MNYKKILYYFSNSKELPNYIIDNLNYLKTRFSGEIIFLTNVNIELEGITIENVSSYTSEIDSLYQESLAYYSILRFFHIRDYMKSNKIKNVVYLESDVLLLTDLFLKEYPFSKSGKVSIVKDNNVRCIPSIILIPDYKSLVTLTNFIVSQIGLKDAYINDMLLLGKYPETLLLDIIPGSKFVFDGAAIGQLIFGTNTEPLIPFINESCVVKYNQYIFDKEKLTIGNSKIVCLHGHCKMLKYMIDYLSL